MSPTLRDRLVQRSLAGRYELFLGLGGGLAVLGLIFILMALVILIRPAGLFGRQEATA